MTTMRHTFVASTCLVLTIIGLVRANWSEQFAGGNFDLSTWLFQAYPQVVGTFTNAVESDPSGNGYLVLAETTPPEVGGSGFGMGIASDEQFADVRFGAVVNVNGDASHNYHGLGARITYFLDNGMVTGAPGIVASGYVMLVHWEDGPANLRIEVRKLVNLNENIMKTPVEVVAPGLDHAHSYYAELDVVGSDPVCITGSLYAYKGGPLVVRTPALIDTQATDAWENAGVHDASFASGVSVIFAANQDLLRPGYRCTFDDISSLSDGPAAANPYPADSETGVPADVVLRWTEAAFATSREVWFGPKGSMQKVAQQPTEAGFAPGFLEFDKTYEWRVDEIGPSGTVTGPVLTFTTGDGLAVDDFESYTDDAQVASVWVQNIPDFTYVFREARTFYQGHQSLRLAYQNQYEPFFTEATRTYDTPRDWTSHGVERLSLAFRGEPNNVEQRLYVRVEDQSGKAATAAHPFTYAVQTRYWRLWHIPLSEFSDAGVDLTGITKLTIGTGDGTASPQPQDDLDAIYIDDIQLRQAAAPDAN